MTQKVTFDLEVFVAYTAIMVLVVVAVIYLCFLVRGNRSKDLTEFQVSAKNPAHVLTIRTRSDHANQLMDHLLDRVLIQIDPSPEPTAEPGEEPGGDLERNL
ncbi:unnamed protein product [Pleuronectes platessa]|uniref:Uncharacterized protein n=1 Tax=Pleuronectes platessa TaxID=8262 RepID=A0A9N7Y7G0_PLEPL|nr:unnamed protein product [Pleuronectes platessa]